MVLSEEASRSSPLMSYVDFVVEAKMMAVKGNWSVGYCFVLSYAVRVVVLVVPMHAVSSTGTSRALRAPEVLGASSVQAVGMHSASNDAAKPERHRRNVELFMVDVIIADVISD